MKRSITIGSRASRLALTQTDYIATLLRAHHPGLNVLVETFSTKGDQILDKPLPEIGGKGLFTLELETALRDGSIDLAVHSLKDLPTDPVEDLVIGAIPERATPNDAFVCPTATSLRDLPDGARIGTSSLRRKAQLRALNDTWEPVDIRGNVETRLRKIASGAVDAVILACAGLERLGKGSVITEALSPDVMLPACGQGALAVQMRAGDEELLALLAPLHHENTAATTTAERSLLAALGGGCLVPIGALAVVRDQALYMEACVCSLDGGRLLRTAVDGNTGDATALGEEAAALLIEQGAGAIIAEIV